MSRPNTRSLNACGTKRWLTAVACLAAATAPRCSYDWNRRFGDGAPQADRSTDGPSTPWDSGPRDKPLADKPRADQVPFPGQWQPITTATFKMGGEQSNCHPLNNEPVHTVTLTHNFEISTTEVTQAQFKSLMGYNPAQATGCNDCPVEFVSWHEAAAYCNALSVLGKHGKCYSCTGTQSTTSCAPTFTGAAYYHCAGFRLPTEAEWEYAYGSSQALHNGNLSASACPADPLTSDPCVYDQNADSIGWYCKNSGLVPHPVGQKSKNKYSLADMSGNVYEWCADWYRDLSTSPETDPLGINEPTPARRIIRGGSFNDTAFAMRGAMRNLIAPDAPQKDIGFRCVRTLP